MELFVLHILSPEELQPTLTGDLKLVDSEDQDEAEVTLSAALIRRYRQTLAAFIDQARQYCSQRGLTYLLVRAITGGTTGGTIPTATRPGAEVRARTTPPQRERGGWP